LKKRLKWLVPSLILVGALLLTSCGQPAPQQSKPTTITGTAVPTTSAPVTTVAPTTAKPTTTAPIAVASLPQGILNVGLSSFGTENFYVDQTPSSFEPIEGVYERLISLDSNVNYIPQLADKWEMSPDAKTWTYTLHKGVQFQDSWGEFTANDVKFSVEQGNRPGSTNTQLTPWGRALANIQVVDDYTIKFNFKTPYVPMSGEAAAARVGLS
jgi:ABC-type transport system substrate-binding protein